ncbi:Glycosyltransferase 9 family protein [Xenorhabdus bovienii str. kraussei Quebec]|uniref:Glycosyltransferase 9 family protein n=1 Tax=Xenorhabdus bovienii str. kraussei Quebec TaxID=1398203 RepID=A0A077PK18_XENBV|nr:glycosyltransferase family 9 protein [Xenorhabdus bovienii]CDH21363.1 Glycosyltransferase 9 family protein [Xenorhabdus bovienii str. kraussei Quebec]
MHNQNKKFALLRSWNRKRNYLMKDIRYYTRLFIAKLLWDKNKNSDFNVNSIKTILLLRNEDKIGDMVVDTILLKELNKAGYIVDFLATETNSIVLKHNPYVRNIFIATPIDITSFMQNFRHNVPVKTIEKLRNNKYDLIIDPSLFNTPIHRLIFFKQLNVKYVIGFNKNKWLNHYDKKIDFDYNENHIKLTYKLIMNSLNIKINDDISYDLHYPNEIDINIKEYLNELNLPLRKRNIIINTFAGNKDRCLSIHQLNKIVNILNDTYNDINIIFLDHEKLIDMTMFEGVYRSPFESLYHTMSLISQSDLIISPDTSIVHIAAAYKKPLIAIYQDIKSNNTLWGPGYNEAIQILAPKGRLHENNDIGTIIIESVKKIFPL